MGSTRRRILAVGHPLDGPIEPDIVSKAKSIDGEKAVESSSVGCVSVDSAWPRFSSSPKGHKAARFLAQLKSPWTKKMARQRHVNIVAGRAIFADRTPRLYACADKQAPSGAARLDQLLQVSGLGPNERVNVISDEACEFGKTVEGGQLARGRILDWLHPAIKFKVAGNSVFGSPTIEPLQRDLVKAEIEHAKGLVWHDRGGKSVAQIKALDASLMARKGDEYSTR